MHLKTKHNYGLEIAKMELSELNIGDKPALKSAPKMAKLGRFYTLMNQEIEHPILVNGNKLYNGGLRVMVAVEKKYDSIDAIISEDIDLLNELVMRQRKDAYKFFPKEQLEPTEVKALES